MSRDPRGFHIPRKRSSRLKSFVSEEKAKAYAEKKGIKDYKLKNLRLDPKVKPKIVVEEK